MDLDGSVESSPERDLLHSAFCRKTILELAHSVRKGHIGSALSVSDIVDVALDFVRGLGSNAVDRDRFVLSKGHASMALYASLFRRGLISRTDLGSYCRNDSSFATHPRADGRTVDFSTGSLGQGITFATGSALAARVVGSQRRVLCLLSDSELNEGSTWEAALFAAHHRIAPLIVLLDYNQQQALGMTGEIMSLDGVPGAWQSVGWDVVTIDGHDRAQIRSAIAAAMEVSGPTLVVCHTKSGSGVSFMEQRVEWHYLPMSDDQFAQAIDEVCNYEA